MTNIMSLISLSLIINAISLPPLLTYAISSCDGPCSTLDDCDGQLICINGKCNDDPNLGTSECSGGGGGGGSSSSDPTNCPPSSDIPSCEGQSNPQYCSPPVTSSTQARLTLNDFSEGGDGGAESACDGKYHDNTELVVALSTGWFQDRQRCGKMIKIEASNGKSTTATVVDECDSVNGCDKEHAFQPPCRNNIVDGSSAVWDALELNQNDGIVDVTWSMA
jgi:hypothetical protein